jgi:hypothetical protein
MLKSLHCKVEVDGVKCRKILECFTQTFNASISNDAAKKKREIE